MTGEQAPPRETMGAAGTGGAAPRRILRLTPEEREAKESVLERFVGKSKYPTTASVWSRSSG